MPPYLLWMWTSSYSSIHFQHSCFLSYDCRTDGLPFHTNATDNRQSICHAQHNVRVVCIFDDTIKSLRTSEKPKTNRSCGSQIARISHSRYFYEIRHAVSRALWMLLPLVQCYDDRLYNTHAIWSNRIRYSVFTTYSLTRAACDRLVRNSNSLIAHLSSVSGVVSATAYAPVKEPNLRMNVLKQKPLKWFATHTHCGTAAPPLKSTHTHIAHCLYGRIKYLAVHICIHDDDYNRVRPPTRERWFMRVVRR